MAKLLNIGFEYKETMYYSLIRVKEKEDHTEYQVTIMEGNLEKLLYGNHIIKEIDGHLVLGESADDEQNILKRKIAHALSQYLKENSNLVADLYITPEGSMMQGE